MSETSDAERAALVAVWAVDGIGVMTYRKLAELLRIENCSWVQLWDEPVPFLRKVGIQEKTIESFKTFEREHTFLEYTSMLQEADIRVLYESDEEYPVLLCEVESRPPVLFARGRKSMTWDCPVAVVGTRRMTSYGEFATEKIVKELVVGGESIVSGFMYGVDAAAHQAAVAAGGPTIAVLGYGFDHLFPRSQQRLFDRVLESGGLFLSEFAPHVAPRAGDLPARNRLVAGMSLGVVVVEAAAESGSHITARLAADEGRDVFAVPGPLTNPYSEGTKNLINDGARLVTSGWDVLRELGVHQSFAPIGEFNHSSSPVTVQDTILSLLSQSPRTAADLAETLSVPIAVVQQEVTLLEISDRVVIRNSLIYCGDCANSPVRIS